MKEVLGHDYPQSFPIVEDARSIVRGSFMVTVTNITYLGQWQHKGKLNRKEFNRGCKKHSKRFFHDHSDKQPTWLQAGLSSWRKGSLV
jgi:hypothetical protein